MEPTVALPMGLLAPLAVAMMPPVIQFGSPVQRSQVMAESFWHVPITIQPRVARRIGPATLPNCIAYLDLFSGRARENAIRLAWGDLKFETGREMEVLRKGAVSLIPVAWRSESGDDRNGYFAELPFVRDRSIRNQPISADGKKHRFKLRIRSGTSAWISPHFYLVRTLAEPSNGHFTVEIEYEGEGTQGL